MVTVFINNICSFINNFTPWCRSPKLCYHSKKGRYCAKRLRHVVTPKSVWYKILGIMANFVLKFSHFRCRGNRGQSDVNFNDTSKLPDLENSLFGATFVALFLVLAAFLPFFSSKFPNFRCHGNWGRSDINFSDNGKLPGLEKPHLVQLLRLYFLY